MTTTYDPDCPICVNFINQLNRDEEAIIYETKYFLVTPNPRWSPHAYRVAIVPQRHVGKEGKYGLDSLSPHEKEDLKSLRKNVTDAIERAIKEREFPLKEREGCHLIDYLERPSVHPSADLFPSYSERVKIGGYEFPKYGTTGIISGSTNIAETEVILASFPKKEASKWNMPKELVRTIATDVRRELLDINKSHSLL